MVTFGVFDSGVGGLSVLRHMIALAPDARYIYFADQAFAPYGERPLEVVRERSELATRALLDRGTDAIVVACNTASAAALEHLRRIHPLVPIIGMEPAVKPAASKTSSGTIAVLATDATFRGELYAALAATWGRDIDIIRCVGTGLARQIETDPDDVDTLRQLLAPHVDAILAAGADVVALGCTHYPFIADLLADMLGGGVELLDPGPAVAAQALRRTQGTGGPGGVAFLTTGARDGLQRQVARLLGTRVRAEEIELSGLAAPG